MGLREAQAQADNQLEVSKAQTDAENSGIEGHSPATENRLMASGDRTRYRWDKQMQCLVEIRDGANWEPEKLTGRQISFGISTTTMRSVSKTRKALPAHR